jgi:hypothetical protein
VRSGKSSKYGENEHKSSLGRLRQKPIGALNLARIGGKVKPKTISKLLSKKLARSGKSSKHGENEYKSSPGCLSQKAIGSSNSARIGGNAKPKKLQNFFLKNRWGLERAQNMGKMSISRVWAVPDKNRPLH